MVHTPVVKCMRSQLSMAFLDQIAF